MLQRGWIGVVIAAGLVTGCAPKKPPTTSPSPMTQPTPSFTLDSARDQLKRANPNTEVGSVVAVLPEANLAAVGDVPTANFRIGDPITFLDDTLGDLTLGSVVAIENGRLHVRYDAPPAGHRAPQIGDFAVHIFNAATAAPQSTATIPAPTDAAPAAPASAAPTAPTPAADAPAASTPPPAPSAPPTPPAADGGGTKAPELNK
jgi:pyruvate dehydrogenase E2 component (dihydrolipoamide acetyltransferase)